MTITTFQMYWITRCDAIVSVSIALTIISLVMVIFLGLGICLERMDELKPLFKASVACLLVSAPVSVFVPTTKEMAAIIVIPKIANNQDVQQLGSDIPKLAREWMEQLRPRKEEK